MPDAELDFQIRLPAMPELCALMRSFLLEVLEVADFDPADRETLADRILELLVRVERLADERAGDDLLPIDIAATVDPSRVTIVSREHGVPIDDATIGSRIDGIDEMRWVQHGSDSELQIVLRRPARPITVLETAKARESASNATQTDPVVDPKTTADQYTIRGYRKGDGIGIARTIYETYGRDYPNPDVYDPVRIDELNSTGRLVSVVCESPSGAMAGTYALERPGLERIGEAGQAVIDPAHRGRGLMRPMRAEIERIGQRLGLHGIFSQPTARHPLSQRMNLKFGSTPSALCLGTTPASAAFRAGVAGGTDEGKDAGRHSCLLYWHPLREEAPIRAFVPDPLAELVDALYAARGRDATVETSETSATPTRRSICTTHYDAVRGVARIAADACDSTTTMQIRSAIQAISTVPGAATIFVDLPIDDPGTARVGSDLLGEGLRPAGIGPGFQTLGASDGPVEDVLRLQSSIAPVDLDGLVVEGELGERLRAMVLDPRWTD